MQGVYFCHTSGCSVKQFVHYAQLLYFHYFGVFIEDMSYPLFGLTHVPPNFPMSSTITARIMLQYSVGDRSTDPRDMATLKSTVNSIVCMHQVSSTTFNHADFVLGITADQLVYKPMVDFWEHGICSN